jgi:hypothetical protein
MVQGLGASWTSEIYQARKIDAAKFQKDFSAHLSISNAAFAVSEYGGQDSHYRP